MASSSKKSQIVFVCEVCGEEYGQWQGKCANCGNWNTLKEFKVASKTAQKGYSGQTALKPVYLHLVKGSEIKRQSSGFEEFDRVLGGGIVPGSVILLGGDPGIGKSTLLLQVTDKIAAYSTKDVLYVSGEESPEQIKLRAERLGVSSQNLQILAATNVFQIQENIEALAPSLVIIDSIQTCYDPDYPSTPGSIVQVRESALRIQQIAKSKGIPIVLVGHITKEGNIAGPRTLEHLVDVVLYLEGDSRQSLRILRSVKNRFGDLIETGIFAMAEKGLEEVQNPGSFLLQERVQAPGSVLSAVMEGTRPLLIEVQALTTPCLYGNPRRTASGFDLNRLNLLLAVLQMRAGINLSNQDVFINIIGGLKTKDPAVDAAVCLALYSAVKEKLIPEDICVIGEVGLAGELRQSAQFARREKEIKSLGKKLPKSVKQLKELIAQFN